MHDVFFCVVMRFWVVWCCDKRLEAGRLRDDEFFLNSANKQLLGA